MMPHACYSSVREPEMFLSYPEDQEFKTSLSYIEFEAHLGCVRACVKSNNTQKLKQSSCVCLFFLFLWRGRVVLTAPPMLGRT